MVNIPLWEICEREAEAQALLDDHLGGGKQSAAEVVAKAQAVLEKARQYALGPGQTQAYSSGLIHSTAHPQKTWVIRITGTDLDTVSRYHFPKSSKRYERGDYLRPSRRLKLPPQGTRLSRGIYG